MGRSRHVLFALVVAVPPLAVVACNQITDIADFVKVDYPPPDSGIDAAESGSTAFPETGSDAPRDTFAVDVQVDALPSPAATLLWARWPMPNPPDAGVDANIESYTGDDAGTVTDNVTQLVWSAQSMSATSWQDAYAQCARLAPVGMWALPTRIQLASLIDWTHSPTIDPVAFPDAAAGDYWTWSVVAGTDGGNYWSVDFSSGAVANDRTTGTRNVRCVKATP
jgi:hypothetical protein